MTEQLEGKGGEAIQQQDREIVSQIPRRFDQEEVVNRWLLALQKVMAGARFMDGEDPNHQVVAALDPEMVREVFREIPVKHSRLSRNAYVLQGAYEAFLAR
jgi:hypothetical protein